VHGIHFTLYTIQTATQTSVVLFEHLAAKAAYTSTELKNKYNISKRNDKFMMSDQTAMFGKPFLFLKKEETLDGSQSIN